MARFIFKGIMCPRCLRFCEHVRKLLALNINFYENRRNEHKISQEEELFDYDLFIVKQFICEARL